LINTKITLNVLIFHNKLQNRFEFCLCGFNAEIAYSLGPGTIVFHHSELPEGDLCEQLIQHVVDYARENHLKIVATCPDIRKYIRVHADKFICVGRVFQPVDQ
jgi:predicted GNAT family acetyltransferase